MEYLYEDKEIELNELINISYKMKKNNSRLVQICCTSLKRPVVRTVTQVPTPVPMPAGISLFPC